MELKGSGAIIAPDEKMTPLQETFSPRRDRRRLFTTSKIQSSAVSRRHHVETDFIILLIIAS